MIDSGAVREIRKQYEKHGWTLRRVLLSGARENYSSLENLFGGAPVVSSDMDALWFSRASANGGEAWELRRLSGAPFAQIIVFGADTNEAERERARRETESKIRLKQ